MRKLSQREIFTSQPKGKALMTLLRSWARKDILQRVLGTWTPQSEINQQERFLRWNNCQHQNLVWQSPKAHFITSLLAQWYKVTTTKMTDGYFYLNLGGKCFLKRKI